MLIDGDIFPVAVTRLTEARDLIANAQAETDSNQCRLLIQQAIAKLDQARSTVVT